MPSIAARMGQTRTGNRRRLAAGLALVLLGALLVGLGAAGAVRSTSIRTGVLVGGVAILACLLGVAAVLSLGTREREVAAAGTAVGLAGLLLFWALPSGEAGAIADFVAVLGLLGFVLGVAVVLATMLASVTTGVAHRGRPGRSGSTAWTRSDPGTDSPEAAVDGGSPADDAGFSPDED